MTNVIGNGIATAAVAKWENELISPGSEPAAEVAEEAVAA